MPFLTQPSPFPGLGLAPPLAPIMVEAGDWGDCHITRLYFNITLSQTPDRQTSTYDKAKIHDMNFAYKGSRCSFSIENVTFINIIK
jgi:hypothetical protein